MQLFLQSVAFSLRIDGSGRPVGKVSTTRSEQLPYYLTGGIFTDRSILRLPFPGHWDPVRVSFAGNSILKVKLVWKNAVTGV